MTKPTYYIENGKIKRDNFGYLGFQTYQEAEKYLFWCF